MLTRLLQVLLPSSCALCGMRSDAPVCAPCHAAHLQARSRCRRCANPVAAGVRHCGACLAHARAFDATLAAADYASPLDQLVLGLKFGAQLALAPWMAQQLQRALLAQGGFEVPQLLCPVPLGALRLRERGFNQALEVARPLGAMLNVEVQARLLVRARETVAQSSLAPGERQKNIRNAFIVAPQGAALLAGRHVGLVDDVMSSGHTLNELAALLKRHGAARVSNLVFARTPPPDH
ncbi:MAG: ComF family protein [Pseudomonadota bacterium]